MEGRLFLRDEELDAGAALILGAEKRLVQASQRAMEAAGLNRGAFDVLMGIRAAPGLTVSQMRERLAMTVPTFARILGQLDQQGLIEKRRPDRDARARALVLSADGKACVDPIAADLRKVLRRAYKAAGAEHVAGARAVLEAVAAREGSDV